MSSIEREFLKTKGVSRKTVQPVDCMSDEISYHCLDQVSAMNLTNCLTITVIITGSGHGHVIYALFMFICVYTYILP